MSTPIPGEYPSWDTSAPAPRRYYPDWMGSRPSEAHMAAMAPSQPEAGHFDEEGRYRATPLEVWERLTWQRLHPAKPAPLRTPPPLKELRRAYPHAHDVAVTLDGVRQPGVLDLWERDVVNQLAESARAERDRALQEHLSRRRPTSARRLQELFPGLTDAELTALLPARPRKAPFAALHLVFGRVAALARRATRPVASAAPKCT